MKQKRADIFFLMLLVLLGIGLSAVIYFPRTKPARSVEVRIDGKTAAVYPLDTDRRQVIQIPPDHTNTLVIRDGAAYMQEANCPDRICVGMHGIRKTGETIVCLPHKLVLAVVSDTEEGPELDAVTGGAQ